MTKWKVKPCGNPAGYFTAYYQVSDPLGLDIKDVEIWHFPEEQQAQRFGELVDMGAEYDGAARTAMNAV